ncbi:hypothetical protein UFOVP53_127 [uncultured Caudovirales phage]|uniref:Trypsin-like peptidase domain containing protein n=1 Tax=uncultured Caudovirales phage TaxID=2100421 RepID=A0A6J5KVZ7_9CAUD|nr:hypothetical protein UFOVP53_127 [uncultured Caudovirales phage]
MHRILPILLVLTLTSCLKHKVADYKVVAPTNGKYHAIIKISNGEGSCSAFVISDTLAMTAGHCAKVTENFIKYELPQKFKESDAKLIKMKALIKDITLNCGSAPDCSLILRTLENELLTEIEGRRQALLLKPDLYTVVDINGKETNTIAIATYKEDRRDYLFIRGNFSKFNKLKIKRTFDVKPGDILRACGFPGATIPAVCVDFEAVGSHNFQYSGYSMFEPGISGGAVIDSDGEVVGIASNVAEEFARMEPVFGTTDGVDIE